MSQSDMVNGGQQCTCIALLFICESCVGIESLKDVKKIDNILQDGTTLFNTHIKNKFAGKSQYLFIENLPELVTIRDVSYSVKRLDMLSGLVGTLHTNSNSLTFSVTDAFQASFKQSNVCFFTIGRTPGSTIAVRKSDDDKYWAFDSHKRNSVGTSSAGGTAVLMEVSSLASLVEYINDLAKSLSVNYNTMPFEVVPVHCHQLLPDRSEDHIDVSGTVSSTFYKY